MANFFQLVANASAGSKARIDGAGKFLPAWRKCIKVAAEGSRRAALDHLADGAIAGLAD
jgi:hypothetical protein